MEEEAEIMSEREEASSPREQSSRATNPVMEHSSVAVTPPRHEASNGTFRTPVRSKESLKTPNPECPNSPCLTTLMLSRSVTDLETKTSEEPVKTCPKWSDVLKSPSTGDVFSPSKELSKPRSLHGLGLMVATDRAKKLSQIGRRCATLLFDVATLQDTFAQSLLKASLQTSSATPVSKTLGCLSRSRVSFAKQIQGLAICIRGSVARPLHGTMASLEDTAPSIFQRYAATRLSCVAARQAALRAREKYVEAIRDAEVAILELRLAKQASSLSGKSEPVLKPSGSQDTGISTPERSPWEQILRFYGTKYGVSPEQLISRLKEVEFLESEYKRLVEEENHAVSQAETMEIMALEATQKLEEERLQFFVESMNRMLTAEKGALDNMLLSAEQEGSDEVPEEFTQEKKPKDFFKNLLKAQSQDNDEGLGVMEADTLGLPEVVGSLRDEVKSCVAARALRGQVARVLAISLEEMASAANTLAAGLEQRLGQEGYKDKGKLKHPDPLSATMTRNEGPKVGKYWDATVKGIDDAAVSARHLAKKLRLLCTEKLEPFLLQVEKDCKATSEHDDQRWKQLCEAARNETKAQMRYQQATLQFEKARDRVKSADNELAKSEHGDGKGKPMNAGVSKAVGNMFSVLPGGGERLEKMLSADARLAIAQTTLAEADQRENKEKNALDAATLTKAQMAKTYRVKAENVVYSFKKEDEAGWTDMDSTMKSVLESLSEFRSDRYSSVARTTDACANADAQASDMAEWTARATTHISKKAEKKEDASNTNTLDHGFALKVEPELSKTVFKLLTIEDDDSEEFDVGDGAAEVKSTMQSEEGKSSDQDLLDSPAEHEHVLAVKKLSEAEKEKLLVPSVESRLESSCKKGGNSLKKSETGLSLSPDTETQVFLAHFCADREEGEAPPSVIESFSCAYWPKEGEGYLSPLLHGRLFLTSSAMYFVGWGDKKIVLNLEDIVRVEKATNMMGTIDNSLRVVYTSDSGECSYFFGSFAFRDNAFHLVQRLSAVARSLHELKFPPKSPKSTMADVPPDHVMKKMEVVLSKKIKSVSIQRFYELVWSEGEGGVDEKPFYGPCLVDAGSHKVDVGKWEFAENETDQFVNRWSGEKYKQRRVINFEFTRTTHLYIGPPVAGVRQTHHCSVDGNDKCVLAMTVEMDGIPYADCFAVEVRWVARRIGSRDIQVDVGVLVDFKKKTMFASKIRAGTIEETRPAHRKLFDRVKAVCLEAEGESEAASEEDEEAEIELKKEKNRFLEMVAVMKNFLVNDVSSDAKLCVLAGLVAVFCLRIMASRFGSLDAGHASDSDSEISMLGQRIDGLHDEMREIRNTLDAIFKLMQERNDL